MSHRVFKPFKHGKTHIPPETILRVYETKGAMVLQRCRVILRDEAAAEDALQEVFARLLKYGGTLENGDVPLTWLYRTAERTCFDILKKRKREPVMNLEQLNITFVSTNEVSAREAREIIDKVFHTLDDKLKQVALLHYLDGLSQEQIGETLGWSRKTIGKKLDKIRKIVQQIKMNTR